MSLNRFDESCRCVRQLCLTFRFRRVIARIHCGDYASDLCPLTWGHVLRDMYDGVHRHFWIAVDQTVKRKAHFVDHRNIRSTCINLPLIFIMLSARVNVLKSCVIMIVSFSEKQHLHDSSSMLLWRFNKTRLWSKQTPTSDSIIIHYIYLFLPCGNKHE